MEDIPATKTPQGDTTAPSSRMDRRAVFFIAIAVFVQELIWNFYDAQAPADLRKYLSSAGLIGLVMG